jgi:DNA-binding CsgD family transcriptional regulator
MDKEKLIELYQEGKNDYEISKIMGINRNTIWWNRKQLNLPSNFSYSSFRKMDYKKAEELVKQNKTDREVAEILGMQKSAVYWFRKNQNITRDNLVSNKEIIPTDRQLSIIIGSLLGDASLRKGDINTSYSCAHGIRQKEYCKWKFDELNTLNAKFSIHKRSKPDKRNGIFYEDATVTLLSNPFLNKFHDFLYKNSKKRITKEILQYFDELSLAVMFMDDGARIRKTITLSTNCFSIKELKIFKNFCKKRFGLEFTIYKSHVLYLPTKHINHFKELVLPYIHPTLMYKIPVS